MSPAPDAGLPAVPCAARGSAYKIALLPGGFGERNPDAAIVQMA